MYLLVYKFGGSSVADAAGLRCAAGRVLFIKDGEVFHQLYRGGRTEEQFYQEISGTLTLLATGGMEQ